MSMSKNVAHTSARGVEPYDKCFGVGVHKKLESGGFSPYPRIERIREMYKTSPLFLDSGRALAFTAAYKEYEAQPIVIKKARALERYMKTCPLNYVEGELLRWTTAPRTSRPRFIWKTARGSMTSCGTVRWTSAAIIPLSTTTKPETRSSAPRNTGRERASRTLSWPDCPRIPPRAAPPQAG